MTKFHIEKIILKYNSSKGELKFRFITFRDIDFFNKLDRSLSNREFSIKVLFNQLETKIDFNDFSNLPDNELEKLTKRYVKE